MTTETNLFSLMYGDMPVRVVWKGQEPWFVLKDVCNALGILNSHDVVKRLDEDEKGVDKIYSLGGVQEANLISESGLYAVILRSNTPKAKPFKRWVTHEVLPSIREKGYYSLLSDREMIDLIAAKYQHNPDSLNHLSISAIKKGIFRKNRKDSYDLLKVAWDKTFRLSDECCRSYYHSPFMEALHQCIDEIHVDQPFFHKYLGLYDRTYKAVRRGEKITDPCPDLYQ